MFDDCNQPTTDDRAVEDWAEFAAWLGQVEDSIPYDTLDEGATL